MAQYHKNASELDETDQATALASWLYEAAEGENLEVTWEQVLQFISNRIDNEDFTGAPEEVAVTEQGCEMEAWFKEFKEWIVEQAE